MHHDKRYMRPLCEHLLALRSLRVLSLSRSPGRTGQAFAAAVSWLSALTRFECTDLKDDTRPALCAMAGLRRLHIGFSAADVGCA